MQPPPIAGVRRARIQARGVDFHLTEAGPPDGMPVLALHGWPQHHYEWRDLLADPPAGLRVIAPDLPGYGWSGPAPHRWQKQQVASDVLALLDQLGVGRAILVGHDWGGHIGYLMALREPERFSAYLPLNIAHPWQTLATAGPHVWRSYYMVAIALFGERLQRDTEFAYRAIRGSLFDRTRVSREDARWFSERARDPVCARAGRDTYRTFLLQELPAAAWRPLARRLLARRSAERHSAQRLAVPTRALFGSADRALHFSLAAAATAHADDYTLELVPDCGHFIVDELPQLVRARLISLAYEFPPV